ncbi:MAG: hypothetical protein NT004_00975 [Bacteroidetes bacterium]|nr:hypothetical protein [Bacteroidota bacterium]
MKLTLLSPRKSLNKAYLRIKPFRTEIDLFKRNLIKLLDGLDETESEEHLKNDLNDFLRDTFYQKFYINTKSRNDLVIHIGADAKSFAGVLIEAKKPSNKTGMIRPDNLNAKAFHELILYAALFENVFAQNTALVKQFTDFEESRLSGNTTDFFYKQIAEPFIAGLTSEICFTWFDFREYKKLLRNGDKTDDSKLIALYKLLSPEHLLKLPFTNDSNSLDKGFYFDALDSLFFRVLARKTTERDPAAAKIFDKVPYLNSSLFEPTELERDTIFISNLQNDCLISVHPATVLKNNTGNRFTGNLKGLDYLY